MSDIEIHHGRFVWRELKTPDIGKSKAFYGELFNWKIDEVEMAPGMSYSMILNGERRQGGLVKIDQPGMTPHWASFVSHRDVDAAAPIARDKGGSVVFGPETMGPGRVLVLTDPAGAAIPLWQALQGDDALPEQPAVGEFCWEDLMTPDASKVTDFYAALLGWTVEDFPGSDKIKILKAGDVMAGGINENAPPGVPPHWLTYVVVESLAKTRDRAVALGGAVHLPEIPVGDFGKIAILGDNVGATICVFETTGA